MRYYIDFVSCWNEIKINRKNSLSPRCVTHRGFFVPLQQKVERSIQNSTVFHLSLLSVAEQIFRYKRKDSDYFDSGSAQQGGNDFIAYMKVICGYSIQDDYEENGEHMSPYLQALFQTAAEDTF